MTATFDDYMKELHERLNSYRYPATVQWAYGQPHMSIPRPEYVRVNKDTGSPTWPLESWHGSHT